MDISVENIFPNYKSSSKERKAVQAAYTLLQHNIYNSEDKIDNNRQKVELPNDSIGR